jgi:hypothetical protein
MEDNSLMVLQFTHGSAEANRNGMFIYKMVGH